MTAPTRPPDPDRIASLLLKWISERGNEAGVNSLEHSLREVHDGAPEWRFFTAFSAVPRRLGKEDLNLSDDELAEAAATRPGWDPSGWSLDQAGRTALVLTLPSEPAANYVATIEKVFSSADVGESVALYQSLPLLAHPERFTARASEGVRSNVTSVFNAVALDSPYPAEYFSDAAWNQMVLKAVFVGSPLHRIQGLDRRANADLARMLVDFARERRAASRPVVPELWRPVGPFIVESILGDVETALKSRTEAERDAAALALYASGKQSAKLLLESEPELKRRIEAGDLTWESFSRNRILSGS